MILPLFIVLLLSPIFHANADDEFIFDRSSFPAKFISGVLSAGIDCEHIKLMRNGNFEYKFTGDCKGWGRKLKGKWVKKEDHISLSGFLKENQEEGETGCAGSYYHTNTPEEKKECFQRYKNKILERFGKFPAIFEMKGKIWITEESTVGVSIETYMLKSDKKNTKGLMFFSDEKFGAFGKLED
ncbi:MAG TPA: hypothetical protein PL163_16710 [Leptospiraceae bacterium]|nr:hypothetical protein [Leptospiraceae bacterium]HMY68293.1 hypothetical protein [Leptospiraceae bacterium]HNM02324.1 hypothetical protein [Leptospiraceae bacterium]HNO23558.1 hypothetical protein [Leptospiraceae bacterium]